MPNNTPITDAELAELRRLHGEAQKTTWQAGAAREIYAAFSAILARLDQLLVQLETASGNARLYADKCTALEEQLAYWKKQHDIELLTADELANTAAGLRRALVGLIAAAECIRHWHDTGKNGEGMIVSNAKVHELWAETAKASAALAASPDEHARRIKAEAYREAAQRVSNDPRRWPTVIANHIVHDLCAEADRFTGPTAQRDRLAAEVKP